MTFTILEDQVKADETPYLVKAILLSNNSLQLTFNKIKPAIGLPLDANVVIHLFNNNIATNNSEREKFHTFTIEKIGADVNLSFKNLDEVKAITDILYGYQFISIQTKNNIIEKIEKMLEPENTLVQNIRLLKC